MKKASFLHVFFALFIYFLLFLVNNFFFSFLKHQQSSTRTFFWYNDALLLTQLFTHSITIISYILSSFRAHFLSLIDRKKWINFKISDICIKNYQTYVLLVLSLNFMTTRLARRSDIVFIKVVIVGIKICHVSLFKNRKNLDVECHILEINCVP